MPSLTAAIRATVLAGITLALPLLAAACSPRVSTAPRLTPIDADQLPIATPTPQPIATVALVPSGKVTIVSFVFTPNTVRIPRDASVTWTNNDATPHRIVSDAGLFDLGQVDPGKSVTMKFSQSGVFRYHCAIHPAMRGTIIVD